jgi:DNA-binding FadR family transcriptional regulator
VKKSSTGVKRRITAALSSIDQKLIESRSVVCCAPVTECVREDFLSDSTGPSVAPQARRRLAVKPPRHALGTAGHHTHREFVMRVERWVQLEVEAASLAVQGLSMIQRWLIPESVNSLRQLAEQDRCDLYPRVDRSFHALIHAASGNLVLAREAHAAHLEMWRLHAPVVGRPGRMLASAQEHLLIGRAILAGDASRAAQLMREHVREDAGM